MFEVPKHISWSVNDVPYGNFKQFLEQNVPLKKFDYFIDIDKNASIYLLNSQENSLYFDY